MDSHASGSEPKTSHVRPEFERIALLLQGGGALGSYQGGVVEELAACGARIDWVTGISIGAINAAIIAGNPPDKCVEKLRSFWSGVSESIAPEAFDSGLIPRVLSDQVSAAWIATFGVPGFFTPRFPPAALNRPGTQGAISIYDTAPLRRTLLEHADFSRINAGTTRLSVGAVNIRSGNFAYFDSAKMKIGPEHIMASGALPPGFPPVEIDGECYWDGGLVSNTPLQYVMDARDPARSADIFQVDLFSARGALPKTLADVADREKDIRYSSRTRLNTDEARTHQEYGQALRRLFAKLPPALKDDPDARLLAGLQEASLAHVAIVHLIYRSKRYETDSKDYLFSRAAMLEHWAAGRADVRHSLTHPRWTGRDKTSPGMAVYDLTREDEN